MTAMAETDAETPAMRAGEDELLSVLRSLPGLGPAGTWRQDNTFSTNNEITD